MDGPRPIESSRMSPSVQRALQLLTKAAEYARDVDCDIWQFAVEIHRLQEAGLSNCDLRWLLARQLLTSAREITQPSDEERRFIAQGGLGLADNSCFVLAVGAAPLRDQLGAGLPPDPPGADPGGRPDEPHPVWDSGLRELRVGTTVVKRFRVPAPNQELILSAFHEEDWSPRIDDPLPQVPNISPKRRLQAAIMCLNRNQRAQLIRFRGNGRGDGIHWELRTACRTR